MSDTLRERFLQQASACEVTGSPLYAAVCRRLADAAIVAEVAPDDRWDLPIRLLAALHYLALSDGVDPWTDAVATVAEHADRVARFVSEQAIQTNEVQRAWSLLPAFLSLGEASLDLVELGPSAGLNLVWDRYRYHYARGSWGRDDASVELSGEERAPVPAELLEREIQVRRRRGIDRSPIDASDDEGARLLTCFVWADQSERLARLAGAIAALRADPPELLCGDYVELLPTMLADRIDGALTVVFQTASTQYLSEEHYTELLRTRHASERPLAWISTRRHSEEEDGSHCGYELELAFWPEHGPRRVARMGYHGQWLEWLG